MELTSVQRTPSSSSLSSSIPRRTYDVFLSFHNKDTGKSFADHLYAALKQRKINFFRGEEKLEQENSTSEELSKAIQESQFAVVVISEHYTSSKSCLIELIKIVECKREMGLTILPVFYRVDPSEISKQKGSFAEAFTVHRQDHAVDEEQMKSWRVALEEVGSLAGWHIHNRNIATVVEEIFTRIEVGLSRNVSRTSQRIDAVDDSIIFFPSSIQLHYSYLEQLRPGRKSLHLSGCSSIEIPNLFGCSRLEMFPNKSRWPSLDLFDFSSLQILDLFGCSSLDMLSNLFRCSSLKILKALYLSACLSLRTLDLSACPGYPLSLQFLRLFFCPSLEILNLSDCSSLEILKLSFCSRLEILNLSNCSSLKTLDLIGCLSLKKFKLSYCRSLQILDLSGYSSLRRLSLTGCSSLKRLCLIDCSSLKRLSPRDCSSLETLDFSGCLSLEILNLFGCSSLKKLKLLYYPSVKGLSLDGCSSLEKLSLVSCLSLQKLSIVSCLSLQKLSLVGCSSLQKLSLISCSSLKALDFAGCSSLEILNLSGFSSFQRLSLSGCSNLETLDLSGCSSLEILYLIYCSSLKKLKLCGCLSFKILDLCRCSSLKKLKLSGCSSLWTIDLAGCSSLQTLDLADCLSLKTLDLSDCSSLQILDLADCSRLWLLKLSDCSSLKNLDLYDCSSIRSSDQSSSSSSKSPLDHSGCLSLKTLDISGCSSLRTLDLFGCSSLERLDLSNCLSLETLLDLYSCSSLKTLDVSGCLNLTSIKRFADKVNSHEVHKRLPQITGTSWLDQLLQWKGIGKTEKKEPLLLERPKSGYEKPPSTVPKKKEMAAYEKTPKEKNKKEEEMAAHEITPKEKNKKEKEMAAYKVAPFPPDLIFHCTDERLVKHYLRLKNEGHHSEIQIIPEVDFYNYDPEDLPALSAANSENSHWFFFCPHDNAYLDYSPSVGGFWMATGFRFITSSKGLIGRKWTSAFYKGEVLYKGKAIIGERTEWMIDEYRAVEQESHRQDDFLLCRLTKKEGYQDGGNIIHNAFAYLYHPAAYAGDLARPVLTMKESRPRLGDLWAEPFGLVPAQQSVNRLLQSKEYLAETVGKEAIEKKIPLMTQGELFEIAATDVQSKSGERNEKSGAEYDASRKDKKLGNEEIGIELETSNTGLETYFDTNILREVQLCLMQGGLELREPPKDELWENAERICLMDNELSILPKNPKCAALLALYLQRNYTLRTIPPSFFDDMPALQILNLSRTGIRCLPESIVNLVNLKRLFLNDCHCFMMLSPKVGELKQLEVLDLEGTDILELPKEIKELTNLTCLKVSLYSYLDDGESDRQLDSRVHCDIISALSHLEELSICVNPDDKWWIACVEAIMVEICSLKNLDSLEFCFPRVELVNQFLLKSLVLPSLSHFRFVIGHHVKRILSRLPCDVEFELERSERCLKYINGVDIPVEIKKLLQYSTSFFLERHATIKKLSKFGIGNMMQLSCCVVGECDQVEVIIDETDVDNEDGEFDSQEGDDEFDGQEKDDEFDGQEEDEANAHEEDEEQAYWEDDRNEIVSKISGANRIVLQSLEYLYIYYMKNLKRIWRGPVERECFSLLKSLTLCTCPKLTTIFTKALLDNLKYLEELTIKDCPSVATLVSYEISVENDISYFLPNFKRILLHNMLGLVTISCGSLITPKLEWMSFYNCPNLKSLCFEKESMKTLRKIKGQRSWWEAIEWRTGLPSYLDGIFVPINE